ncbi:HNH endonuclease [Rhodococcus sp. 06-156-3C]|uniref:HNH endonuclease n=1 Tax=Nocardiaceae TaxID=85025 RepID=UPI000522E43B|nr:MULTISPECIES: HNH endonuclease domain-containing protein [Rhodococcus]OZD11052.1 HNH endonuclease [Rhodococcus sp. 06-156-4C]OZD14467.1 HNH endonuclease [Rhodococcus sp. 06-156-4a]OZD24801.1 HNH endonuclease [Rhodococcus sp. 06-156-3C]OZD27775.1 HNH endonuclease [Rhodococcus sp. 06-156-3b]OZD39756.1 HNH endonuclease [Rhodococcus sp. 06-156-3]
MKKPETLGRDPKSDYDLAIKRRSAASAELLLEVRDRVFSEYWRYFHLIASESAKGSKSAMTGTRHGGALIGNYRLMDSGRPLDGIRMDVIQSAFLALCWMCEAATAITVDHFLPKSRFPEFSILYFNLLPVCSECNNNKRDRIFSPKIRFGHPYVTQDLVEELPWLDCVVGIQDSEVTIKFRILKSADYFDELQDAFTALKLERRYQALAIQEVYNIVDEVNNLGVPAIVARGAIDLSRRAVVLEMRYGHDYWKVPLLKALDRCDDFWTDCILSAQGYPFGL